MKKFKTCFINSQQLPLLVEPTNPNITWEESLDLIHENSDTFKELMLKHGGLLFRGFPVNGAQDFQSAIEALKTGDFVNYIGGGAPRDKVKNSVYTSTEAPPSIKINLHNEMSFADYYPSHIFFYCDIPPQSGGETFIGDARQILKDVDPAVTNRFVEKGLKYVSRYYGKSWFFDTMNKIQRGHRTWMDVFETDDRNEVEKICRENGIEFEWHYNDWLEISRNRPAVMEHPKTNETVWFNQVHLFDYNPRFLGWWRYMGMKLVYWRPHTLVDEIFFQNNSKLPRKDIYHIHDVLDKNAIYFPWQKGDFMALDNILTMHARAPFTGKRRILTAMTK